MLSSSLNQVHRGLFIVLKADHKVQVTQIEGTKLLTEGRSSKSDGLSKNCFILRKEVGEGEGRAHFRATQEPFMWVVAI